MVKDGEIVSKCDKGKEWRTASRANDPAETEQVEEFESIQLRIKLDPGYGRKRR